MPEPSNPPRALGEGVETNAVVVAVIPTFHAPESLHDRVADLLHQVAYVVLVDDGTHSISSLHVTNERVLTTELSENGGIARALNVGIAQARDLGATHILTLDQDSWIAEGYISAGLARFAAPHARELAAVVPGTAGGSPVLRMKDTRIPFDPIQSGQLVSVRALDIVGPFLEQLFIDAVDTEWTLRARSVGFEFEIVPDSAIGHSLGDLVPLTIFGGHVRINGKARHVLYHAPFRTYYVVRNSIIVNRRYSRGTLRWRVRRNRKLGSMVLAAVLLSPDRKAQVRALWYGWRDGRAGITGRISAKTLRAVSQLPPRPR